MAALLRFASSSWRSQSHVVDLAMIEILTSSFSRHSRRADRESRARPQRAPSSKQIASTIGDLIEGGPALMQQTAQRRQNHATPRARGRARRFCNPLGRRSSAGGSKGVRGVVRWHGNGSACGYCRGLARRVACWPRWAAVHSRAACEAQAQPRAAQASRQAHQMNESASVNSWYARPEPAQNEAILAYAEAPRYALRMSAQLALFGRGEAHFDPTFADVRRIEIE